MGRVAFRMRIWFWQELEIPQNFEPDSHLDHDPDHSKSSVWNNMPASSMDGSLIMPS